MQLHLIESGKFKLDGGAMFGIVPKRLWHKLNPPDEYNMCTWSMRCLLVQTGERNILVDTGIGDKQDEKFRSHFEPHGADTLLGSLAKVGLEPEAITDVLLTHLHFDHVGGAVRYDATGKLTPTFPNATYWSNERHWNWALQANIKERASLLRENFVPIQEAGLLRYIDVQQEDVEFLPGFNLRFLYGHTEAMMMPSFQINGKTIYYGADLIPSSFHVGLPYIMAYDVRPLHTLEEKKRLLSEVMEKDALVLFEHDPALAGARLRRNEKGRIVLGEPQELRSFLSLA